MNKEIVKSPEIITRQKEIIEKMHAGDTSLPPEDIFFTAVAGNALKNYNLWHLEDDARMTDVSDSRIADIKRKIDKENQKRNDFIEKIDEVLLDILSHTPEDGKAALPVNSETPGSIIDRMCIAGLKIYHMEEEVRREDAADDHRKKCKNKLEILEIQLEDLAAALDLLIDDLFHSRKQLRVYRQFKMYNDPALNPSIYGKKD
ncbi:MAG: DUF4254 domain-containing protein [Elusimicrobiota bacterium]